MYKNIKIFPAIVYAIIFLTIGCKSSLKDKEVINLITNTYKLPIDVKKIFITGVYEVKEMDTYNYVDQRHFKLEGDWTLINGGYMEIQPYLRLLDGASPGFGNMTFHLKFTDKAKPFIFSTYKNGDDTYNIIKTKTITFGNLISLREVTENEYEAEFSLDVNSNLFETAFQKGVWGIRQQNNGSENVDNLKVKIYRYEAGWAIAPEDISKIQSQLN